MRSAPTLTYKQDHMMLTVPRVKYWIPRNARVLYIFHKHEELRVEFPEKGYTQIQQMARREWVEVKNGGTAEKAEEKIFWEEEAATELDEVLKHNAVAQSLREWEKRLGSGAESKTVTEGTVVGSEG